MNKKEIMNMLKNSINKRYEDLLFAKSKMFEELYIEGIRSRLDELLLIYHIIQGISFIEACKELEIDYKEVNVE